MWYYVDFDSDEIVKSCEERLEKHFTGYDANGKPCFAIDYFESEAQAFNAAIIDLRYENDSKMGQIITELEKLISLVRENSNLVSNISSKFEDVYLKNK